MNIRKVILSAAVLLAGMTVLKAQNVSDLIISEVMAEPDSTSISDDYGRKNGWIEIYNKSTGTVNYAGCYLTDDLDNLTKSLISKSDNRTKLGPRQVIVFQASGSSEDGTFYTSFKIRKGSTIYLVSNDGKTVIDSIDIPSDLPAGKSVAKFSSDIRAKFFSTSAEPCVPSPMQVNGSHNAESGSQKMAREDKHGFTLAGVSVFVVFCALVLLWFIFGSLFKERTAKPAAVKVKKAAKKNAAGAVNDEIAAAIGMALDQELGGDTYAAIATALHLYLSESVHDTESFVITIKPSASSDWAIKSQTFRKSPRK